MQPEKGTGLVPATTGDEARKVSADGRDKNTNSSTSGEGQDEITELDLRRRWPAAFNDRRRPLAIGIHEAMGIPPDTPAMKAWVQHQKYLESLCKRKAVRIDLHGDPVEPVTAPDAWRAMRMLGRLKWGWS